MDWGELHNKNKLCCEIIAENRRYSKIYFGKDCRVPVSSCLKNWVRKMNRSAFRESKNFSPENGKIVSVFDGRIHERFCFEEMVVKE
ncbi:MAG: hypothetical protein JXA91_00520 [Candidatus Thermoplasmatota archaeon]|nr:hypothetical protein [Candidatus Thermoplasmatota archaeon]